MNLIRKYQLVLLGAILGAIGGYLYYHFAGCEGGSCAITSKPLNSTLYGALLGSLFVNTFQKEKTKSG